MIWKQAIFNTGVWEMSTANLYWIFQDLEYEKSSLKSALIAEKSKEKAEIVELELKLG